MGEPRYCLQCDDGTVLEHGTRALSFAYHGATTHVPDVSGWHCPVCGDVEFDAGEGERYSTVVEAFCAARDRELGATVRAIRKKLGLRQSDAGRLFGGGVNAFSEYERGKTQPHKSTLLLLRLLDRHPELLHELSEQDSQPPEKARAG